MRSHYPLIVALALLATAACDQPLPTAVGDDAAAANQSAAYSAGMTAVSISGTIGLAGGGPPGNVLITPSAVCHLFDLPVVNYFDGDVEGFVTFHEKIHDMKCDGSKLVISGPFEGEVTWSGRTGSVQGRFKIDCTGGEGGPPTCVTKLMSGRGVGDLEGVLFRFEPEPGWFPFTYSGTVLSH